MELIMKKKRIVCGVVASALALSVTLGGCSSLVSANSIADMNQTIATVNISKAEDFSNEGLDAYKDAVGTTSITKRELISYFLNVGYSYVNSGYGYEYTFNMLVDNLVNTAVITQYSVMYLLKEKEGEGKSAEAIMSAYNDKDTLTEKYEYVLGEDSVEVKLAKYSLMSAINSAIDSYEEEILEEDEDSNKGSGSRTVPGGVNAEQEKYYPRLKDKDGNYLDKVGGVIVENKDLAGIDYGVYTGYAGDDYSYLLADSGIYQDDALEGTTPNTRKRAYNNFLSSVNSYNLIDVKKENMKDVLSLKYIQDEYVNQLEQQIISKYFEVYEKKQEDHLKDYGDLTYIKQVYADTLKYQTDTYKADGFTSTLDSMSDTSFVLYAPETEGHGVYQPEGNDSFNGKFGFVYNILLPFNAEQSNLLSEYKALYADSDEDSGYTADYFIKRNELLKDIKTTDQRSAWFNGATDYAFDASEKEGLKYYKTENSGSDWLFFENNLVNKDRYEDLEKYAGLYPYNGQVIKKDDGYVLIPNKLSIDDMLEEFSAYIDFVLGTNGNVTTTKTENYYEKTDFYKKDNDEGETKLDYKNFLYAYGSVKGVQGSNIKATHAGLYDKKSAQYLALSAVNELQYAYTTDTGVLSNYVGYSVNAADTNYIKEFEYAAQYAINEFGAGGFAVCAGDYGWHLIYVTYVVDAISDDDRAQFEPNWEENIDVEGTFENLFYEWVKSKKMPDISSTRQNEILTQFNIDKTVSKYQEAYQDLLDLG